MNNPSPDPLTMLVLGGACALLVEVAEFIVWSNDLSRPTKIRPSGANCSTVGLVSPLSTTESRNPLGNVDAPAGPGPACMTSAAPDTTAAIMINPRQRVPPLARRMSPPGNPAAYRKAHRRH
jgi:hypothetical protein